MYRKIYSHANSIRVMMFFDSVTVSFQKVMLTVNWYSSSFSILACTAFLCERKDSLSSLSLRRHDFPDQGREDEAARGHVQDRELLGVGVALGTRTGRSTSRRRS